MRLRLLLAYRVTRSTYNPTPWLLPAVEAVVWLAFMGGLLRLVGAL